MIQEREDAKCKHARDNIQLRKFVGQESRSSAPTAPSHVAPAMVQPPPRLAARPPHRSRFAEVGLAPDATISVQQTKPGLGRQSAVSGRSSSNTTRQAQSKNRCPAYYRRVESKDAGDMQISTPINISSREVRRNHGESRPLPPVPLPSQKIVSGRRSPSGKHSIPRKPVAPSKSEAQSPPPPPLRILNFGSSAETSPHSSPTMNSTWQHFQGDTGRLRTRVTAQMPQISRVRESIVHEISPLTAVIYDAREALYTAPMDSYFRPASSNRTAPSGTQNARVDSLPRMAPIVYRPPTSPPPYLRPGRRGAVPATPGNIVVDLDSVEEMFNTAASQAQSRNQLRDWQRSDTSLRRTSNGRRRPRQGSGRRTGHRT